MISKHQLLSIYYDPQTGIFSRPSGFIYNPDYPEFRFGTFRYPKASAAAFLTFHDDRFFNGPFTQLPYADRAPVRLIDEAIPGHARYALTNIDLFTAGDGLGAVRHDGAWRAIKADPDTLTFTWR